MLLYITLCLFIGKFSPFTFRVIINVWGFPITLLLFIVCSVSIASFSLCFCYFSLVVFYYFPPSISLLFVMCQNSRFFLNFGVVTISFMKKSFLYTVVLFLLKVSHLHSIVQIQSSFFMLNLFPNYSSIIFWIMGMMVAISWCCLPISHLTHSSLVFLFQIK